MRYLQLQEHVKNGMKIHLMLLQSCEGQCQNASEAEHDSWAVWSFSAVDHLVYQERRRLLPDERTQRRCSGGLRPRNIVHFIYHVLKQLGEKPPETPK